MTDEERDAYFREAEAALEGIREEIFITSYLTRMSRRRIRVFLDQDREDAPSREFIAQRIEEVMPVRPGVNVRVGWGRSRRGGGGDSESSITLKLRGPDSRKLAELSEEVVRRIKTLDHVTGVEAELEEEARDELHFIIQREAAQRQGLPATLIGGSIDYTLRGRRLSDVRLGGRDLEMRAIGNDAAGEDLSVLQVVRMPAQGGNNTATLAQVTEVRVEKGYGDINRENRETVLGVEVTTDEDDLEALAASIDGVLDGFEMPRGYYLGKGDRLKQLKESENDQIFALTLAIVFVFLLMGVLFESASIPFAIVFSIPFAFLGTFWILYLTNTPFDIMAGVGLIILVGIVVNNAIVLIDTVQQRRDRLMRESAKNGDVSPETARAHLYDAVIEGSVRRLRPVLMTALTTIFGLIPMAAGDSGIVGIPYAPLGRSVIGGLLASTLLTLFVVPFLYVLLAHVRAAAGRASARIGWRKPVAPASEPPAA